MKSITGIVIVAASLFGASNASLVPDTFEGCFTSTTGMSLLSTLNIVDPKYDRNFNSKGSCGGACNIGSYATYAMEDKDCYCGQKLPPAETETNSTNCNIQCPGYQTDGCKQHSICISETFLTCYRWWSWFLFGVCHRIDIKC